MAVLVIECNDDVRNSSTPSLAALIQRERERESVGGGDGGDGGIQPSACVPYKGHSKRFMGGYWAASRLMELFPLGGRVSVSGKVRDP